MSERVWHKGPPPHIGWWNASVQKGEGVWRWWNGEHWSWPVYPGEPDDLVFSNAALESLDGPMSWTDYWPENARVPRLDPTGGHWTFNVDGLEPKSLAKQIDIAWRNGRIDRRCGSRHWRWSLSGCTGDILAWRPAA